jgi:hypothetical protein
MDDLQQNYDHEIITVQRKVRVRTLFKFLASFSTALVVSWFLGSTINNLLFVLIVIASTGILSLSLLAINKEELFPDSRFPRIILIIQVLFTVLSIIALSGNATGLFIASSITGLLLLIIMDITFKSRQKGINFILYGGQAFISGLLIVSFLCMLVMPFLFLAAIKAASALYLMLKYKTGKNISGIRILRFMLLIFAGFCLVTRIAYPDNLVTFIFIAGELIEMILYNYDSVRNDRLTGNNIEFQSLRDEKEGS